LLQDQVRDAVSRLDAKVLQCSRDNEFVEGLQLVKVLGQGGFATVYLGTWKGAPAAVKVRCY